MTVLGDIAKVIDCEHRTAPGTDHKPFGYSVGTRAVRGGRISIEDAKPVSKETYLSWTRRATPAAGDLIFSREAPMGEVGAVPTGTSLCLGQRTVLLRLDTKQVDHRFLLHILMAPQSQRWIDMNSAGSTVLHLNVADVRRIPIPVLPPLDEQRRIVDLIEDHLSRLDAAESYLRNALKNLKALKASVLASLHAGEPLSLGALSVDSGYGTSEKCVPNGAGAAVVRIPNLVDGQIDLSDEKRVLNAEADVSAYMLAPGDVLIVRTNGSIDLIGRSAVVQPGIDAAFASYLIRYRVRDEVVRPRWVQIMLSTPQVRGRIESLAASSAGQHNLSLGKLDQLELPVPSTAVQDAGIQRIVGIELDVSRLAVSLAAARSRTARLRSSILDATFSGRLAALKSDSSLNEELIDA
ncbi:restriction endonuclease subunit S [Mycobacterium kansasii]